MRDRDSNVIYNDFSVSRASRKEYESLSPVERLLMESVHFYNRLSEEAQTILQEQSFWGWWILTESNKEMGRSTTRNRMRKKRKRFEKDRLDTAMYYLINLKKMEKEDHEGMCAIQLYADELRRAYEDGEELVLDILCKPLDGE